MAKATALIYRLQLKMRTDEKGIRKIGPLEIVAESLEAVPRQLIKERAWIAFPHHRPEWLDRLATGGKAGSKPFQDPPDRIFFHQDGNSGRPREFQASTLSATVLSGALASEAPTVVCARQKMASWRLLQFEPTALRSPDPLLARDRLGARGDGLPATLYRLANGFSFEAAEGDPQVYQELSSDLREILPEVRRVEVLRDDKSETLSLMATMKDGSRFPARSLSDGTLRFLALAVLERDPTATGVICLEGTWRRLTPSPMPATSLSSLIGYLSGVDAPPQSEDPPVTTVVQRKDIRKAFQLDLFSQNDL